MEIICTTRTILYVHKLIIRRIVCFLSFAAARPRQTTLCRTPRLCFAVCRKFLVSHPAAHRTCRRNQMLGYGYVCSERSPSVECLVPNRSYAPRSMWRARVLLCCYVHYIQSLLGRSFTWPPLARYTKRKRRERVVTHRRCERWSCQSARH
jgi:hypothetical protein